MPLSVPSPVVVLAVAMGMVSVRVLIRNVTKRVQDQES